MGEAACLVRSFSQPAAMESRESNEVVPSRVLTESVSFGRFASESLQWEKWSAFTQNRYLEEVERFTKPGSVAQKKAFFEAHFKNRAAGRATTQTKIEEVDVKSTDEVVCQVREDSLVDSEVPIVVDCMAMEEEVSNVEVDSVVPLSSDVQSSEVEVTSTNVENSNLVAALDEEISTSLRKEKRSSSSGSKTCNRSSKLETSCVVGLNQSVKKARKEPPSSSKRSISASKSQRRSTPEPFLKPISCASSGNTDKKFAGMPQNGSRNSTNAKVEGKADKKKILAPSSVHMSLNFASSPRQTTKTAPRNLARKSTTQEKTSSNARTSVFANENEPPGASKSRKRPLPRTAKESSKAAKCSTSASSVRLPELPPPNNRLSEDKRENITAGSSISCRIPNNVQRQSSTGSENLLTHSRIRGKSFTVSSPFNFRSDERAEKRKEFFKKIEEKKKEDAVKEQLSCGFKATQNTHLVSEGHENPQVGSFQVPQISLTSPRFRRNQTSGTENIKKSHQALHKVFSSLKTTNTRNASMEKHKSCKIHPSSRFQIKKITQENSSPNIQ